MNFVSSKLVRFGAFKEYFDRHWFNVDKQKLWAPWYRKEIAQGKAGADWRRVILKFRTNMIVESSFKVLKYSYLMDRRNCIAVVLEKIEQFEEDVYLSAIKNGVFGTEEGSGTSKRRKITTAETPFERSKRLVMAAVAEVKSVNLAQVETTILSLLDKGDAVPVGVEKQLKNMKDSAMILRNAAAAIRSAPPAPSLRKAGSAFIKQRDQRKRKR